MCIHCSAATISPLIIHSLITSIEITKQGACNAETTIENSYATPFREELLPVRVNIAETALHGIGHWFRDAVPPCLRWILQKPHNAITITNDKARTGTKSDNTVVNADTANSAVARTALAVPPVAMVETPRRSDVPA